MELIHENMLMGFDAGGDVVGLFQFLVDVKHSGEGDFVADLRLRLVNPRVRIVRQDFAGQIGVDVLIQRDVLRVASVRVRHGPAFLQNLLAVFIDGGAFDGNLVVAELHVLHDAAAAGDDAAVIQRLLKIVVVVFAVGLDDQRTACVRDVHTLAADGLAARLEALARVDEQHFPFVFDGFRLRHDPDVGGDARVVEGVVRQLDDGVQPVVFDEILADVARAGARVAREERRAVLDDGHAAAVLLQLRDAVQQEEHLPVAFRRQPCAETAGGAFLGLRLHGRRLPLPVDAERRIGDDIIEMVVGELVVVEGVSEFHVVRIAAADERVRLGDAVGEGVELLPEGGDNGLRVQLLEAFLHAGEHLAGAHRHVIDGLVHAVGVIRNIACDEQVAHGVDDVAAGEMRSGLFVIAF